MVYDAEHFFDGFRADRDYALAAIKAAADAGADWIAHVRHQRRQPARRHRARSSAAVKKAVPTRARHPHAQRQRLAVANALAGVEAGCTQVQGTMNGWGERCGNANLISIIPALQLKMERRCVPDENLAQPDRAVARGQRDRQHPPARPRALRRAVGVRAQGRHARRRRREGDRTATSTSPPERVGNRRHIVVSELAGRGNVRMRADELGVDVQGNERVLLERIKELESQGYQFEAAEGSFELLGRRSAARLLAAVRGAGRGRDLGAPPRQLDVRRGDGEAAASATRSSTRSPRATGPVHALDGAFHKALNPHFPLVRDVHLVDYKVRILDPEAATGAKTRVLIEAARGEERWSTIGVSPNIIEASATALADALELPLARARAAGAAETKKAAS